MIAAAICAVLPFCVNAQSFTDVTSKTYERTAIASVITNGWMLGATSSTFGYGTPITPDDWLRMLMFLRTSDACPELGTTPNQYWTPDNIRGCLAGAGVPIQSGQSDQSDQTDQTDQTALVRRDEAMQQLFALRRRSFAFQELQTKPAGYVDPTDLTDIPANRLGAMIAADRLKLLFRTKGKLLPASPLLREDAALSVTRFTDWEKQGGVDSETNGTLAISKDATLNHWKDLDTDIYVIKVKTGGDTIIHPILPYRSYNPAKDAKTAATTRDNFVYEPVSALAKESGALAAINGSYFDVQWPWGPFEDVAIVDGKTTLSRTDRSTFVVCSDGKMYIGKMDKKALAAIKCTPKQALGAGPLFMSKGTVLTQSTKEGFDEYTLWERRVGSNARTAIAISTDRKTAYVIVVAGKSYPAFGRGGSTLGAFLKSKYPDIGDAMMYDGGGSTALVANGALLVGSGESGNTTERSVISALGIFSKKAEASAAAAFAKEKAKRWDSGAVAIKVVKPTTPFDWQTVKEAKSGGSGVSISGTRGSSIQVLDTEDNVMTYKLTFDLVASDKTSKLTIARRQGVDADGWKIPTELHVINPKDGTDTDIIKLIAYMPASQKPDLKTFDVIMFGKSGIVFGDATGRSWYYYTKDRQLSPATFLKKATAKTKK